MSIHLALKSEWGAAWHTESLLANSGSRGEHWGKLPHRNCPWCWSGKRFSLLHTCVLPQKTLKSQGWHFNAFYCISILFSDGSLSKKKNILETETTHMVYNFPNFFFFFSPSRMFVSLWSAAESRFELNYCTLFFWNPAPYISITVTTGIMCPRVEGQVYRQHCSSN